ncbi:hypothetical protein Tco_0130274, partial [Tanacetum coccineum]
EDPIWNKISCKLEEPSREHMTEENIYALRKEIREIHASINNDLKVLTAVVEDIARVFLQDNNENELKKTKNLEIIPLEEHKLGKNKVV